MALITIANYIGYADLAHHFNKYVRITDMAQEMDNSAEDVLRGCYLNGDP